jgi:cobalt-zinc-cadmium efflux system protein
VSEHRHEHRHDPRQGRRLVGGALALTVIVMLAEAAGGWWAGSLALLSDAGHMLTDVLALALSYVALRLARLPATPERSFGYMRVEILSALLNGSLLILVAGAIVVEALERMADPPEVRLVPMLAVALVGLAANGASALLLRHAGEGLNLRGAFLHVMSDLLSSAGVVLGGLVILLTGWRLADPLLACVIAAGILWGAFRLVREAVDILLESAPGHIAADEVAAAIRSIPGVREVHDLHIWSITPAMPALSGHVVARASSPAEHDRLLMEIQQALAGRFGLRHATIQIESEQYAAQRSMVRLT